MRVRMNLRGRSHPPVLTVYVVIDVKRLSPNLPGHVEGRARRVPHGSGHIVALAGGHKHRTRALPERVPLFDVVIVRAGARRAGASREPPRTRRAEHGAHLGVILRYGGLTFASV